jgi:hypothetical protein
MPDYRKGRSGTYGEKSTFVIEDERLKATLKPGRATIPGVWISAARNLVVPPNAVEVTAVWLNRLGVAHRLIDNRPQHPVIDWRKPELLATLLSTELKEKVAGLGHPLEYLLEWQRQVLAETAFKSGSYIRVDAGGGKTIAYLAWALRVLGLIVVVCKAGARTSVYEEALRVTKIRPILLEGEKAAAIPSDARMVILGWETLHAWIGPLLAARPVTVVYDEIHKLKAHKRASAALDPTTLDADGNASVKFTRLGNISDCASQLSRACRRRIGSTATPISNRTEDLWSQNDALDPGMWGDFLSFAIRYCEGHKNTFNRWDTKGTAQGDLLWELRERMKGFLFDLPRSVTHKDLPEARRETVIISAGNQSRAAGGFLQELRKAVRLGDKDKLYELRLQEAATAKRSAVLDRVGEALRNGQKVMVFTGRIRDTEALADDVRDLAAKIGVVEFEVPPDYEGDRARDAAAGVLVVKDGRAYLRRKPDVFMHHGEVQNARAALDEIRWTWMGYPGDPDAGTPSRELHPGPAVLICTAQSFGESYNMHSTDLQLHAVLPATPKDVEQREGRVKRHGQKRKVLIVYLIAEGTVDERLTEILLDKLPAVEAITSAEGVKGLAEQMSGDSSRGQIIDALFDDLVQGLGPARQDDGIGGTP